MKEEEKEEIAALLEGILDQMVKNNEIASRMLMLTGKMVKSLEELNMDNDLELIGQSLDAVANTHCKCILPILDNEKSTSEVKVCMKCNKIITNI